MNKNIFLLMIVMLSASYAYGIKHFQETAHYNDWQKLPPEDRECLYPFVDKKGKWKKKKPTPETLEGETILVTRRAQPHTLEERLVIARKIISDEEKSQGNSNRPSDLYKMRQRALAGVLGPIKRPADRAPLGQSLLWFNSFDKRKGSAFIEFQKPKRRNRSASVPAEPTNPHKLSQERSKSAPNLNN